jgi:hypothetical protein
MVRKQTKNHIRKVAQLVGATKSIPMMQKDVPVASALVHDKFEAMDSAGSYRVKLYVKSDIRSILGVYEKWYDHDHRLLTRTWEHGVGVIAKAGMAEWERRFTAAKIKWDDEVHRAGDRYDEIIANAKRQNAKLFKEVQNFYPSQEDFVGAFSFEKKIRPIPVADDLRLTLPDNEVELIREELRKQHADGLKEVYGKLHKHVSHARKAFTVGKRLSPSILDNCADIVAALDALNIPDGDGNVDANLEKLGTEITERILSVDIDDLKQDKKLKSATAKAAADLEDKLKGYC